MILIALLGQCNLIWSLLKNFSSFSKTTSQNFFIFRILLKEIRCIPCAIFAKILPFEKMEELLENKNNFYRISRQFAADHFPLRITSHVQQLIICVFSWWKKWKAFKNLTAFWTEKTNTQKPAGLELRTSTRAKRVTNRNDE